MTNKQLKNLKDTLWTTADQLRANSGLKSTEYAEPILGLIFLRFAATIGKIYDDKGKVVGYKDDSIGDQDFSLNPGRYVGVVIEDDGLTQEEFKERMMAYYTVLSELNADARNLEKSIAQNLQELFEKK